MGEKNQLRDACEYALLNGGKRLRPILVVMIADALDRGLNVMPVALSVEFFHTASLIADDLPCMDDDDERRNHPSLHKEFGESVAILASYALIAEGYGGIYRNSKMNPDADAMLCLEAATRCAGIAGATNGQFLDLYPPDESLETVKKILYQKTVTLFEISFIFGWIFGGGNSDRLEEVKLCAYHLGMAFQIADDLIDGVQDVGTINIAAACGREEAFRLFQEEISLFTESLKSLGLWTKSFQEVVRFLKEYGTAPSAAP
ncbi:MAG: polyprenyl synthetase family protein [Chlamydiae bacterium CG10_big_fil_rev_8_21_14_0_10_42_34]|nr:MAG: polyprenyl synthetase family protein [Chlamydiae bacterium CG10_big_fil_rev_8_21_14_0_10_42_34]